MPLTKEQFKFFADFIESNLGIVYGDTNAYQLENRIREISKSLEMKDETELYLKAKSGITGHLKQLLLDTATNNETSFFRDPKVFNAIENRIFPELIQAKPATDTIHIWSAASSFGQEPYTLTMIISELASKKPSLQNFSILATDISKKALDRASQGLFSQLEIQRGLPAPLMVKYFTKTEDNQWQIKPELKRMIQFKELNLLNCAGVFGEFDLILCRNVLIYQRDEKKKEIIRYMTSKLKPGGFLIMGATESLVGLSDAYDQIMYEGAVIYQKKKD
ncbi:MAG: chemotaxis protein CheR [Phyllobacteriaceae bacterium]|nr:chemotaxis protein CheR [Phyllobacteriaceae bacterium]